MPDDKIEIIVEDREELPTNVSRKIKVLEMPVFTEDDKKNIERMMDRLDKFISDVYSERVSINVLREEMSLLRDGIKVLAEKPAGNERIVNFIDRAVRGIEALAQSLGEMKMEMREAFNERLGVMDNKVEEKLYALDSTISYMKGLIIDLSEKIGAVEGVSDTKFSLFVENISEKFDAYMANLNNRLDNLVLQVVEPTNDMSMRLDAIRNEIEILKNRRVRAPTIKVPRIRVQKLPTNAFEMLAQARRNIRSKRVAKKRQPDKKRLIENVDSLQNRVLDLFIFSAIGTERKTITAMKKNIPVSEAKVRKRVNDLARIGKLRRIKRGKKTVYSVV